MARRKKIEVDESQKPNPLTGAEEPKTFTEDEVSEMIKQAAAKAVADALASQQPMRVFMNPSDEMVTILYMDACADDNVLLIPGYGSITPGGYMQVPKREFAAQFMSLIVRKLLKKRKLIVVDGLTEDERIRWGVNYKVGEILDLKIFDRLLDLDTDELVTIFKSLCVEHKQFVVSCFMAAYFPERGKTRDNRVTLAKVQALNEASRIVDPKGMFREIINRAVDELKN